MNKRERDTQLAELEAIRLAARARAEAARERSLGAQRRFFKLLRELGR